MARHSSAGVNRAWRRRDLEISPLGCLAILACLLVIVIVIVAAACS